MLSLDQGRKVLEHAWKFGHFRNPEYPSTHDVKEADVANLALDHPIARSAIASLQESDANLDDFCQKFHGRRLAWMDDAGEPFDVSDGDAGPATLALTDLPRCAVPDFSEEEAGAGGWLTCDPMSTADHSCRIKFDDRRATNTWKTYLEEVKANAVRISADVGLDVRYVGHDARDWESSVEFKNIPGNVIGFYYLPGRGCQQVPQGALDTSYNPDIELASLLWIHEGLGHGIGLSHTRGGIMNPSIMRTAMSWRDDPSWSAVQRLYGGEPLTPTEPPPPVPGPVPGPGTIVFNGYMEIEVSKPGKYLVQLIESSGI